MDFSLKNGVILQQILNNPGQYNLTATDKLLLEDGRESMVKRTRYGFFLGATLSPLPLFRGQYAPNKLRNLPPLMDAAQRPNLPVIRARLIWIAQSIVLTTLGSGLGTWIGFKLGFRALEHALDSLPGSRQRVMAAFSQAHRQLEAADQQRSDSTSASMDASQDPPALADDEDEKRLSVGTPSRAPASLFTPPNALPHHNHRPVPAPPQPSPPPSRWEELRQAPPSRPSTWQTIRERHTKSAPTSAAAEPGPSPSRATHLARNHPALETSQPTQTQDEFENLLDCERLFSAGLAPPSAGHSSSSKSF